MEELIRNILLFFVMSEKEKSEFLPTIKSTFIYINDTQSETDHSLFFFVYKSFTVLRHFMFTDTYGEEESEEIVADMTSLMEIMFLLKRNRDLKTLWNIKKYDFVSTDDVVFWNMLRRLSRDFLGKELSSSKMTMNFDQMKEVFLRLNYDE